MASSSGESEQFEYIEELGYKDEHILYHSVLSPIFVPYQTPIIVEL